MSAYTDSLKAQAAALRAWGHTLDVLAGEREAKERAPKAPKPDKPSFPAHDYKPFTLTPAMLSALRPKRASARCEICRHCGVVRTASSPWRFWVDGQWQHAKPPCKAR